jgi:uncharacterized protein with GYD domain
MPRYLSLITFTDEGTKTIRDFEKRVTTARERIARAGGNLIEVYLSFGEYDSVAITEWPDDELALRGLLESKLAGHVRSHYLRLYTEEEAFRITKAIGA